MLIKSRAVAFLLASSISLITVLFLSLVQNISISALLVAGTLSFGTSFILIFVTFDFLIFREINSIYSRLRKINREDFDAVFKVNKDTYPSDPIRRVKQQLTEYASKKQHEVDELKKVATFRREFIADISHELKTPLFAAQGFILTLQDGAVEDQKVRGKFLKKAAKSLDALKVLVEDLLTLSQIETGDITMYFEVFDIQELVREIFEQFENKADKKSIQLIIMNPVPQGVFVNADYQRIYQVITNLIQNAIKYIPDGCHVWVSFKQNMDENTIRIRIRDDGKGIAQEHLHRLFERFYRVEKSRSKKRGGTGLGLAIVKHIIDKHDSEITVKSELGKGTCFEFFLKMAVEQEL